MRTDGLKQTPLLCMFPRLHGTGEFGFTARNYDTSEFRFAARLDREAAPYCGLRAYDEPDSPLFFGREGLRRRLVELVEARPLTLVAGESGTSKSSLLRASLLPDLREPGGWTILSPIRPHPSPLEALVSVLPGRLRRRRWWPPR
ncbi:nSTAND1 domain-containing NTPase [Tautonia plasticadhaerens]|uniref:Novel STAND NTPase 1 domain-containing protein n=1 Tax=Tautonia plasticadhaerens TaxID=2527974 RepID=A0A518H987_9BACT|nr:ATP-binding protein [Tautonia plasticadhaerens]QDV37403.1 hypothetical protein ElP_53420 [Tautonia plasticadhaerens]